MYSIERADMIVIIDVLRKLAQMRKTDPRLVEIGEEAEALLDKLEGLCTTAN